MIGRLISALSNTARLYGRYPAHVVWGIADKTHDVVGTSFDPSAAREQGHPLEFWLAQRLRPSLNFAFKEVQHPGGRVVLLEVPATTVSPVEFDGHAYIRISSATPKLSDYPDRLRALWDKIRPYAWERGMAAQFLSGDEVLAQLDAASFFTMTGQARPSQQESILAKLVEERLIETDVGGRWNITNLGALLLAFQLDRFDSSIARKRIRFVRYGGNSRADTVTHRREGQQGYALDFEDLVGFIDGLVPRNEHIDKAFRTGTPLYPPVAIRELVANALIHQDLTITGTGPLIELFNDRLEITNPGAPLVNPDRFIDCAPRSRNEALAALMRRMRICEEQGSGIDKVVRSVELFQLPAPDFRAEDGATRVVLYAPRRFAEMTTDEYIRACYQHAVLQFISGARMRNSTLRERFGIEGRNAAQVSRIIRLALDRKLIRPADPVKPQAAYVPHWV